MKNKILSLLVLTISLSFCLNACKDKTIETKKNETNTRVETESDNTQIKSEPDKKNAVQSKLSSTLRPKEEIELSKVYTDTVSYLEYNDDSDYWYFLAQKNNDTIQIIYHADMLINELVKGDKIVIDWEIKRLQEAGDEDITYVRPYLVSFRKISSVELTDKKVKVLWREDLYDEDLKQDINTIILNEDYLKNIHEPEKAALAYIATYIGNECEWDKTANENRSNLKCILITQLDLGYQCSTEHLGFLTTWFSKDPKIIEELKKCPTIPNTATIQSTFNEIELVTNNQNQTISINYSASKINVREGSVSDYSKTEKFKYSLNNSGKASLVRMDTNSESSDTNSFVISCGSGCAMTYSESKVVVNATSREVTFKVEMYINESLSEKYTETYVYNCDPSTGEVQIKLKGEKEYKIEDQHPQIQKKLKSYTSRLCNN